MLTKNSSVNGKRCYRIILSPRTNIRFHQGRDFAVPVNVPPNKANGESKIDEADN